jgi:hypothetical protein
LGQEGLDPAQVESLSPFLSGRGRPDDRRAGRQGRRWTALCGVLLDFRDDLLTRAVVMILVLMDPLRAESVALP